MKTYLAPLAALALALTGGLAAAQATTDHSSMSGMDTMTPYMAAMDTMTAAMTEMKSTGNADADFLMMMIPHHQSAIDMARVQLETGSDPASRDLAERIIAAQESEIAEIRTMLAEMGFEPPAE